MAVPYLGARKYNKTRTGRIIIQHNQRMSLRLKKSSARGQDKKGLHSFKSATPYAPLGGEDEARTRDPMRDRHVF